MQTVQTRSDCSWKSNLIRVYTVCLSTKYFKNPASKIYRTHIGPKWVFIWVLYGQPIRDSWGICNMVPCWTHIGKAIWEPYGNSMGPVWETSTHTYLPEKKKKLHIFTQVPSERDLCTCASYCTCVQSRCLKDIGVFFNSWKWWPHAYLYIPLNFKSNRDIWVKKKNKKKYDLESTSMSGK